jgi:hypothetical protein
MWHDYKKRVAPLYQDETYRRLFATASGRRPQRNRKPENEDQDEPKERFGWLPAGLRRRINRWKGEPSEPVN